MKSLLLVAGIVATSLITEIYSQETTQDINQERCNLINVGTFEGGSDVIENGVIQKYFDQRITDKYDLYYIPFEKNEMNFYAKSPVPFAERPNAQKSDRNMNAYLELYQEGSEDANLLKIRMEIRYECPQSSYGIPVLNLTLAFEGCPTYVIAWQKSCGNDITPPMNGLVIQENNSLLKRPYLFKDGELKEQDLVVETNMDQMYLKLETVNNAVYFIDAPYFKNLYQAQSIMYPVLKSNAAFGGEISTRSIKHLLVEFNCLGIKGTQDVIVVIPSKDGYYQPIEINFRKKCSHSKDQTDINVLCLESIFSALKDDMEESVIFDLELVFFMYELKKLSKFVFFSFFLIGNFVCCYMGLMRFKGNNESIETVFSGLRGVEQKAKKQLGKAKRYFQNFSLPQMPNLRSQANQQSNQSSLNQSSYSNTEDKAFTNNFGQDIEIDMAPQNNPTGTAANVYGGI